MKQKIQRFFFPVLAVLAVSAFPVIFLYCQNADEVGFSEVAPVLLSFMVVGVVLLAVSELITRSAGKSAIITIVFMLILANFSLIEHAMMGALPKLRYWHTAPIVIVICLHIAYAVWRFFSDDVADVVVRSLSLVFSGLLVLNVATSAPQIVNHIQAQRQIEQALIQRQKQSVETAADMPNIYMLIFDEYSNFPQMEEYYDYDNAPLQDFLNKNNFAVSLTSHNESITSSTVQTNMVCLDYVVSDRTSESEKAVFRKNALLFDIMRQHNYNLQIFELFDFYNGYLPVSDVKKTNAATISGETLLEILMKKTIVYPFYKTRQADNMEDIHEIVNYLSDPRNLPSGGTFTLAYFCFPHTPFLVDENGNPIDYGQSLNWADKQYYLGQFKYATKLMLQMAQNIVKNDPDCILLLLSDHGARASGGSALLEMFTMSAMNSPLNAVYYRNENGLDIEGLTLINTLRTVLNHIWDMDFKMINLEDTE